MPRKTNIEKEKKKFHKIPTKDFLSKSLIYIRVSLLLLLFYPIKQLHQYCDWYIYFRCIQLEVNILFFAHEILYTSREWIIFFLLSNNSKRAVFVSLLILNVPLHIAMQFISMRIFFSQVPTWHYYLFSRWNVRYLLISAAVVNRKNIT